MLLKRPPVAAGVITAPQIVGALSLRTMPVIDATASSSTNRIRRSAGEMWRESVSAVPGSP